MMYPILCKVRYESLHLLLRHRQLWIQIGVSFVLNWILAPLLMVGLAWAFLPDRDDLREGLIYVGIARCIAMVLIWNDLAGGDPEYCAVLVAFNSILQIVLFAPFAIFYIRIVSGDRDDPDANYPLVARSVAAFLGESIFFTQSEKTHKKRPQVRTDSPAWDKSVHPSRRNSRRQSQIHRNIPLPELLHPPPHPSLTKNSPGIPLGAAILTRFTLRPLLGASAYQKNFIRYLAPFSLIGLLYTIIVLFASQGHRVVHQITSVLRVAAPLLVYFFLIFSFTVCMCWRFGFGYRVSCTQGFTAASNNFELAIAVVVAVYGADSDQALASTVGPLIEVPVLVALVYVLKAVKRRWKWED